MTIKESPSLVGRMHREALPQNTTRNLKSTSKNNYPSHKKRKIGRFISLSSIY